MSVDVGMRKLRHFFEHRSGETCLNSLFSTTGDTNRRGPPDRKSAGRTTRESLDQRIGRADRIFPRTGPVREAIRRTIRRDRYLRLRDEIPRWYC